MIMPLEITAQAKAQQQATHVSQSTKHHMTHLRSILLFFRAGPASLQADAAVMGRSYISVFLCHELQPTTMKRISSITIMTPERSIFPKVDGDYVHPLTCP